jgi:hypothetical protein
MNLTKGFIFASLHATAEIRNQLIERLKKSCLDPGNHRRDDQDVYKLVTQKFYDPNNRKINPDFKINKASQYTLENEL